MSLRNRKDQAKTGYKTQEMYLTLPLIRPLFTEASSEMVSVEKLVSRSHSLGWETQNRLKYWLLSSLELYTLCFHLIYDISVYVCACFNVFLHLFPTFIVKYKEMRGDCRLSRSTSNSKHVSGDPSPTFLIIQSLPWKVENYRRKPSQAVISTNIHVWFSVTNLNVFLAQILQVKSYSEYYYSAMTSSPRGFVFVLPKLCHDFGSTVEKFASLCWFYFGSSDHIRLFRPIKASVWGCFLFLNRLHSPF